VGLFKAATYNVNSVRSRLHIIIPWLDRHRPDILCMQETKVEDRKFPKDAFENLGYRINAKGNKQYNGVAIASREEPEEIRYGFDDDGPADMDRIMIAVFKNLIVVNCYVPQGRDREDLQFDYKLEWFGRLRDHLEANASAKDHVLCLGDLNVAREEIDVHNPKRLKGHVDFTPEVWEKFDEVLSWGLSDIFRKHCPGVPEQYTFFDYRVQKSVERKLGWRVDHILGTQSICERSVESYIDLAPRLAEKPSDHTILVAEFDF